MPNKRETKQIRISKSNHRRLKRKAINQDQTIAKFIDSIVDFYFESCKTKNERQQL